MSSEGEKRDRWELRRQFKPFRMEVKKECWIVSRGEDDGKQLLGSTEVTRHSNSPAWASDELTLKQQKEGSLKVPLKKHYNYSNYYIRDKNQVMGVIPDSDFSKVIWYFPLSGPNGPRSHLLTHERLQNPKNKNNWLKNGVIFTFLPKHMIPPVLDKHLHWICIKLSMLKRINQTAKYLNQWK